jgi:hypothetical protein
VILRQEGDRLTCVRQVDHAALSGTLAEAWGTPPWDSPRPRPEVLIAAARHDDAWKGWDQAPEVRDGRPLGFYEVDRRTTTAMYAAGVDRLEDVDRYAALMVSLHYSGFFTSHWGWQPFSTPERFAEPQAAALRQFVDGELQRQGRLREALALGPEDELVLEVNYKWLQLWDRISLDICRQSAIEPWAIHYPAVPSRYGGGAAVELKFAMVAPGRYTLNPYPLGAAAFSASVRAAIVGAGPFATNEAFLAELRAAAPARLTASIESVSG